MLSVMKVGIELILDEEIARREKEAKTKLATYELGKLKGQINARDKNQ